MHITWLDRDSKQKMTLLAYIYCELYEYNRSRQSTFRLRFNTLRDFTFDTFKFSQSWSSVMTAWFTHKRDWK